MDWKKALYFALLVMFVPAAVRAREEVYLLRTLEDPSVATNCAPGDTALGALVYAPGTRQNDGLVVKDAVNPIGTAVGCGRLLSYMPFDPNAQNPFAIRFELPGGAVEAAGTCTLTELSFPNASLPVPVLLVGCSLKVKPDVAHAIVRGEATSSSVFVAGSVRGYGTGSFWTIRLYMAD
jgi:hypothetical protein